MHSAMKQPITVLQEPFSRYCRLVHTEEHGNYSAMSKTRFYLTVGSLGASGLFGFLLLLFGFFYFCLSFSGKELTTRNMKSNQNELRATCTLCLVGA